MLAVPGLSLADDCMVVSWFVKLVCHDEFVCPCFAFFR